MPPAHSAVAPATMPALSTRPALPRRHQGPAHQAIVPGGSLARGIAFGLLLAIPLWAAIVAAVLLVVT